LRATHNFPLISGHYREGRGKVIAPKAIWYRKPLAPSDSTASASRLIMPPATAVAALLELAALFH